ncbi:pseudouridine synthase [Suttonella ornithocola]|uniref:Dual-specificity RNA pseudouridine synthase RluA n=1 Tax=Suttonella ornithocola TaxID=279832 RepID=A0A380MLS1_9GAMM|nr:pseudouridine synthase [Suttonella ornithocola]SUO93570.1 Ribosomal large subunit pseudouridine synthase A [Suttonella ornithocola]
MNIVFENGDIIVVDKPAGLLSVPGRGEDKQDSVETRIKNVYPGAVAVHRLDMATSGIMLLAKHKAAERHYKSCFEKRQTEKHYYAIVHGQPYPASGEIHLPLRCDWENRPRQMVCFTHGKPAQTLYQTIETTQQRTRLKLIPITGRSHQLRVHLAEIGHPIIGDNLYAYEADYDEPRLLLHAHFLQLPNLQGERMQFISPVPF